MYDNASFMGANPASRFRLSAVGAPAAPDMSGGLSSIYSASEDGQNQSKFMHPDNPLFWFAGIAAVAFGLMAASTTVRVGPIKGGLSVGKT